MKYQTISITTDTKERLLNYKNQGRFDTMEQMIVSILDYMDKQYIMEV